MMDGLASKAKYLFILFIYLFILYLQLTNLQLKTDIVLHTNKNSCFNNKKTC